MSSHKGARPPTFRNGSILLRAEAELEEESAGEATLRALLDATSGVARVAVLYSGLKHADIEQAAIRGTEVAIELGDRRELAHLLSLHGMFIVNSSPDRFAEGVDRTEEAIQVAKKDLTPIDVTRIERSLAWTSILEGRFDRAL